MELTIQQVVEAVNGLQSAINANRAYTPKAAYRLAYLRRKLRPAHEEAVEADKKITATYNYKRPIMDQDPENPNLLKESGRFEDHFSVPPDKVQDFAKQWKEFAADTVTIAGIDPLPLSMFYTDGDATKPCLLSSTEINLLGDLITFDETEEGSQPAA